MQQNGFKLLLVIIYILLLPVSMFSQEKITLNLQKSVDLALEKNPGIRIAEKEVEKARAGVWEAYSTILPKLDASANLQRAWEIQENTIPNFIKPMLGPLAGVIPELQDMPDFVKISFGLKNTISYGAVVSQPLFLGGAGYAGIKMATAAKNAAELNLDEQRQELIFQTANAFLMTLLAKEVVSVQREALEQAKANLEVVTKKYEAGMATGFDKMRAEVDVANLEPTVLSAKNDFEAALTQLKTVLGLNMSADLEIEGQFNFIEDEFGSQTLDQLKNIAFENRPALLATRYQKNITSSGITLARSEFMPKLFFQTDYSFIAMKNDLDVSQDDFSKGFTSAVSLQIPLFHGFASTKKYQKAKLDHRIMLDTEKQIYDGISAEVEIGYNNFQVAKENYFSSMETVELAEEALRLANLMYEEGANTQLDVLSSQLSLTQAKLNYLKSLFDYQLARYNLRKVTGKLKGIL
ncbi:hypothetical protein GF337_01770 [candidate division KSB1 bacterium]|nr:hypothetical protein [candidate division KSB1 bacterium]